MIKKNVLDLIIRRNSTRDYRKKIISTRILNQIVKAGIWGPSLTSLQPGRFIIIKNKKIRTKISFLAKETIKTLGISGKVMFSASTMKALEKGQVLIAIYNSGVFRHVIQKFAKFSRSQMEKRYVEIAEQAEISAISAAIQNMILTIEDLGLGSCWLHMPVFCEKEISKLLNARGKLMAILCVGYPLKKEKRSSRNAISEMVRYIN